MRSLLEFKRSFMKTKMLFRELSEYSKYTFDIKVKDFYEHITVDPYMESYFFQLKEDYESFYEKYNQEIEQGAVFLPDNKNDRLLFILEVMREVALGNDIIVTLRYQYDGESIKDAYNSWYNDSAKYVMVNIFSDIEFDIQTIENLQDNKDKDDINIKVPENMINNDDRNTGADSRNKNAQNMSTEAFIGELHNFNMYSNDKNRTVVVQHAKDLHEEASKEAPSKSKVKKIIEKIKDTGETEAIDWLLTNLIQFPVIVDAVEELL